MSLPGRKRRENSVRNPDRVRDPTGVGDIQAKLMLVLLCFIWGVTWPLMKIALNDIPPLSMRSTAAGIGAVTLLGICLVKHRSLRIRRTKDWLHIVIASLFNLVGFSLFSAFAQIATATERVAILTYAMPIWAVLLAWAILGEHPTRMQRVAIALCVVGLAILIRPLATTGIPLSVVFALATGLSWAIGTVYLKWARIDADPVGVASWQLTFAFFIIAGSLFIFEGRPHLEHAHPRALFAVAFTGIAGNGIAYGLWFDIVRRLSAVTASLGVLSVPVIGIIASVIILGERPTASDILGFALIFAASACVMLARPAPKAVTA
jgi:drug/metabolite transporter (DMT)-like permease